MAALHQAYAHTPGPTGQWHLLENHLRAVAERARSFATSLGAGELGYYAGLWHDIGKLAPAFQQYLIACAGGEERTRRGPDHKAAGALLASQYAPPSRCSSRDTMADYAHAPNSRNGFSALGVYPKSRKPCCWRGNG
jgi:hypothetical protein